jgi:hypothetical protein
MADNGVKSTDLTNASLLDEVIGNRSGTTVAATMFTLAQQLLGSGPLADAIALDGQAHWRNTLANLNSVTGQTGDNGFVVDDGANNGIYRWNGTAWAKVAVLPGALGFRNLDDTSDLNKPLSIAQLTAFAAEATARRAGDIVSNFKSTRNEFVITDGNNNVIFRADADNIDHPVLDALEKKIAVLGGFGSVISGRNSLVIVDDNNNVVAEINGEKLAHPSINSLLSAPTTPSIGPGSVRTARVFDVKSPEYSPVQLIAGVSFIAMMGQSNSYGSESNPAISLTGSPWAKRFTGGVRPNDNRGTPIQGAMVALNEFSNGTSGGETSASGAEQAFRQLVLEEDGIDLISNGASMLFSNYSSPGATIEGGIAFGTPTYNGMASSMDAGATVANAANKPFAVAALLLDIGESNQNNGTTQAEYVALNTTLRANLEAKAIAASGIDRPLPVFINQMNTIVPGPTPAPVDGSIRPNIALAQLQLAREEPNFCLIGPSYHLPYNSIANIHYTALGQKLKGAYQGRAMKRWLFDGIKPRPLAPLSAYKQGRFVLVKFDVQSRTPLVIDNAAFPGVAKSGLQIVSAGGAALAISSVSVAWGDTLMIELSSATTAPATFRIGWTGVTSGGNLGKLQTCIRDNAGEYEIFDPDGIAYPLHNWAVAAEETIV